MTALGALRRQREATLSRARSALDAAQRVCERAEERHLQSARLLAAEGAAPATGQPLAVAQEAVRQTRLTRLRARVRADGIAATEARIQKDAAVAAVAEALRGLRAVDVLEQRAARVEQDRRRRRDAAETEDRNRR